MVTKIGSEVGVCVVWKNNILILLLSSQKLYFCDEDAICDVIIQEPVWKWRHNYRHKISRDPFAELLPFRHTQPCLFLEKQTGPKMPFVVLPLYQRITPLTINFISESIGYTLYLSVKTSPMEIPFWRNNQWLNDKI